MICQNHAQGVSKNQFYRRGNLQNSTLLWAGSPSRKLFFGHFIQRLGGINRSQVMSIGKGAHPCTSSSEQGGGKRVLEDFF